MKYYIIAGEASGDLHGSNLMKGLYEEDPSAVIRFWGGDLMAEVYSRIENYFQTAKPYLEGNVSICEVAQRLYTNKQYVSVAVKRFSGLNFCQYVNRYRIRYAMELFRGNRTLRMSELAQLSGFNSVTSFNISFRYFMDQPPGDWCRKCRNGEFDEMTL